MARLTALSEFGIGFDMFSLSDDNFWYVGNMSRYASGPTYIMGDTTFNQSRGGEVLRFDGSFTTTSQSDPVTSVSILGANDTPRVTLTLPKGTLESDLRHLEADSDLEAFTQLLGRKDRIVLSDRSDTASGFTGDDTIWGGAGNDRLLGGSDDDTLYGGKGRDTLDGQTGLDLIYGGAHADRIDCDWGDDIAYGGAGNDRIYGGHEDDILHGDAGNDRLIGGFGDDTMIGGAGDDRMKGGFGRDVFVFAGDTGDDTVLAFNRKDRLNFSADLWAGDLTPADVIADHADPTAQGVLITFDTGGSVLIAGLDDPQSLVNLIQIA